MSLQHVARLQLLILAFEKYQHLLTRTHTYRYPPTSHSDLLRQPGAVDVESFECPVSPETLASVVMKGETGTVPMTHLYGAVTCHGPLDRRHDAIALWLGVSLPMVKALFEGEFIELLRFSSRRAEHVDDPFVSKMAYDFKVPTPRANPVFIDFLYKGCLQVSDLKGPQFLAALKRLHEQGEVRYVKLLARLNLDPRRVLEIVGEDQVY